MHEQPIVDCGMEPKLLVELIDGDLTVEGIDDGRLTVRSRPQGKVSVDREGDCWVIRGVQACRLAIPRGSQLVVTEVRGDLSVQGLASLVEIDRVGGDANLEDIARVRLETVGGNVRARRVAGGLTIRHGGGDGRLSDVPGPVDVSFGGDLVGRSISSPLSAQVGGDAVVEVELSAGAGIEIKAGGDITCRLGGSPSANVSILAGGSRSIHFPARLAGDGSGRWILGEGGPELDLQAGGDVWLGSELGVPGVGDLDDVGARVAASVGKTLAEVEASLSAVGAMMETIPEAEISSKVQRVVERALRHRGRQHASRRVYVPARPEAVGAPPISDPEKLKILQMVEQGKLSVDDAEKLFKALEN
jgi:hypothetical protein